MEIPFLLSLDTHSEEIGDERDLTRDIPFLYTMDLSFSDHVHRLLPLQGSPCCLK
jgi:hypothetical protein